MKVYKYRGGSKDTMARDADSIVNNYFWAPKAEDLNDPTEAYMDDIHIRNLSKHLGSTKLRNSLDNFLNMRHRVGIYSLSKTPLDELMWAYYGGSHTGFCIEYDMERLTLEARSSWQVVDVSYQLQPQSLIIDDVIDPTEANSILIKMIGTKSLRWSHEEETRIITTLAEKNYYAPAALTGIYFGCRCDEEFIQGLRKKLKGRSLNYYKMDISSNAYRIEFKKIDYDPNIDGDKVEYFAPIEPMAIPDINNIDSANKPHYRYLKIASNTVRRDTSCKKLLLVNFSTTRKTNEKPDIYVQYETNVPTQFINEINRYFTIDELQISHQIING